MLMARAVGHPVARVQVGGSILEGAAEDQRAFSALVIVDGADVAAREAGQVQAGAGGCVLLKDRHAAAAEAMADPAPLGFRGEVGTQGLQGLSGG
jgi:hypothetical protein